MEYMEKSNKGKMLSSQKNKYTVIILMTSGTTIPSFGVEILNRILDCSTIHVPAIFISDEGIAKSKFGSKIINILRRRKAFIIVTAFYYFLSRITGKKHDWQFLPQMQMIDLDSYSGDVCFVKRIHSEECVKLLSSYGPDLCFHSGHIIIRDPVLSLAKDGVLGYHHGDLTKHRGGLPCFWELYYGEDKIGVTTQLLSQELDTGKIVMLKEFQIEDAATFKSLHQLIHYETTNMAIDSINLLSNGFIPITPKSIGKYHNPPTLAQWIKFQYKIAKRRQRLGF
jgi:folate-dependent phosphoribosylglycinamide formyltransferase PurN